MKIWMLVPLLWGLYNVVLEKASSYTNIAWMMLFTSLATAGFATGMIYYNKYPFNNTATSWLILAAIISPIATFLGMYGISQVGAVKLSSWEISYPLFAALFGYLFFSKQLNFMILVGAIFMIIGGLIIIKYHN